MSIYFSQERTIDPYSSYYSNIVNKLTRIISRGVDCLNSIHALEVISPSDATAALTNVIVTTGEAFKDDLWIQCTTNHTVDFTDTSNYITVPSFSGDGIYYVILDYVYAKTKPAPRASIRIMQPSEISGGSYVYGGRYLFLKAVEVIIVDNLPVIVSLNDWDPNITTNRRVYSELYCGVEDTLPTFSQSRDEARLLYVRQ